MDIIHVSNLKVKANITINEEKHTCDIVLDRELNIESIGIQNDIMLSREDIDASDLVKYQTAINDFITAQTQMILMSKFGCFYRLNKTYLEYAAQLSNGECDTTWATVESPTSVKELNRINEHFKTNFTRDHFEFIQDLEDE